MKNRCQKYIEYHDSAGQPVYSWKCYCGTSACMENIQIEKLGSVTIVKEKTLTELTKEEEDLFYKKAFETKLI